MLTKQQAYQANEANGSKPAHRMEKDDARRYEVESTERKIPLGPAGDCV